MNSLNFERLKANIDQAWEYDFANHKVFGSAYLVLQEGKRLERCYGSVSLHSERPLTSRTVFRLASMTKPITAIATLILAERGMLALEDRIDRFFPEFGAVKIKDAKGNVGTPKKIPTIKNILTHTSGIGSDPNKLSLMTDADKESLDSAMAFYLRSGLDFEPDSMQRYSGTGAFDILTKIIEKTTGMDYLSFLTREIFIPCAMQDTTFLPSTEQKERMVAMHQRAHGENAEYAMKEGCVFESIPATHFLGGAGLVSTLDDYGNFAQMLLNQGEGANGRILKESTFRSLCTAQVPKAIMGGSQRWGLGVRVITEDSYPYLPKGSFGWSGAYGSHFWIDPQNKIVAVFMKNSKYDGGAENESARNFERAVYSSF